MYTLDKIKKQIVKQINKALAPLDSKHLTGLDKKLVKASDLVYPPQPDFGDLSLACFGVAKKMSKTPIEIAEWLVSEIRVEAPIVGIKSMGPYVNFTLDKTDLSKDVIKDVNKKGKEYGKNKSGKDQRVMIEYSNANTHKEYHVGHLRNICYGDAVNRILAVNGYKSIPVSYINDFGIHVAKTLWHYESFTKRYEKETGKKLERGPKRKKGYMLGKMYQEAVQAADKDILAQEKIIFMMKRIESRQGKEYKLWEQTRKWSIEYFEEIYKDLGVKFKKVFYESELIDKGMDIVGKLYEKKFLVKSDGAVIADLEEYNLGVLLFLRSDGTALYPVADLPLALEKSSKYKLDKTIYIVDVRQSLYFKQLFKTLELLTETRLPTGNRVSSPPEMIHLGYEFVKLPTGMMASRTGHVITYRVLHREILKRAKNETKKRHKDWGDNKIKEVATVIAVGAMKFEMIKIGAGQIITFDINKALRFDGFTAAYLQYAYARINSILKNADDRRQKITINFRKLVEKKEYELVMKLAKYPGVILRAGENYDPSEIAKYLFELAQNFNDYYHSVPVLKAEEAVREARLALISAVSQVIENGLELLGIGVVEEM